ncbi:MAG: hypothetical protein JO250_17250, partial [Armatimonadetes bacterium]|nr:hypothetical protein [Armatimonadota bacterium]
MQRPDPVRDRPRGPAARRVPPGRWGRRGGGDGGGNAPRRTLGDPREADLDRSRDIDMREGTLLGLALSLNNVGGGLSAGLVHLNWLWTALGSA